MSFVNQYSDPYKALALPSDLAVTGSPTQRTALQLAAGYIFYTILWLMPAPWCAICRGLGFDPSELMAYCAHAFKALQFYTIYELCKDDLIMPQDWLAQLDETVVVICVSLILLGQLLNSAVYQQLGTRGVYYGVRFGHTIPWCTAFPYNIEWLKNPQYWGTILTFVGMAPLLQIPPQWLTFLIGCYVYMMMLESKQWTSAVPKAKKALAMGRTPKKARKTKKQRKAEKKAKKAEELKKREDEEEDEEEDDDEANEKEVENPEESDEEERKPARNSRRKDDGLADRIERRRSSLSPEKRSRAKTPTRSSAKNKSAKKKSAKKSPGSSSKKRKVRAKTPVQKRAPAKKTPAKKTPLTLKERIEARKSAGRGR